MSEEDKVRITEVNDSDSNPFQDALDVVNKGQVELSTIDDEFKRLLEKQIQTLKSQRTAFQSMLSIAIAENNALKAKLSKSTSSSK